MSFNRRLVNIAGHRATLYCEVCDFEDERDIRDDLADGLPLATIARQMRDEHADACAAMVDQEIEDMHRVYGGEG